MNPAAPTIDVSSFNPEQQKMVSDAAALAALGKTATVTGFSGAALLNTSSASRSNYASNMTALGNATSSMTTPPVQSLPSGTGTGGAPASTGANPNTTTTGPAGTSGAPSGSAPSGSTTKAPATFTPTGTLPNGTPIQYDASTGIMTDPNGNQLSYNTGQGQWIDPKTGLPPANAPVGTGNPNISTGDGDTTPGSGIDPVISKQYNDAISASNDILTQAKANLDAAKATLQNDPMIQQIADGISAKYDVLIKNMTDKNALIVGRSNASIGAFGGLGVMSQNFMSAEMDAANERIASLVTEEQSSILKATQAQKDGDIKALNDAMTQYEKANNDKITAIGKLLTATNNEIKEQQTQKKSDQAAQQKTYSDLNTDAKAYSAGIAKEISGMSADAVDSFIQSVADSYGQSKGLTDEEKQLFIYSLRGSLATAQQAQTKSDSGAANTKSEIDARDNKPVKTSKPSTSGQYKFKPATVTSLYGAGNTQASVSQLQADINKYGIDKVLKEGKMDDKTRSIIQIEFNPDSSSASSAPSI